ncbi:MAG: T9SS type A sorting domain-containing protein, partial [Bacteroidales bacterium]
FLETFGWENPADPKGWTAPPGYYMLDPTDNGYNWHWYGPDSLVAQWVKEPPFQSTTAANGSLTLFADKYNEYKDPTIPLDNSIGFPPLDCSSRSSVIVRYETVFMNYSGGWKMLLEVSVDNWVHSAALDVGFGCGHKGRPNNTAPGVPAIFEANISDLATGISDVRMRFTWRGTDDYFWQIDDFQLSEAWDNDLQMRFAQMEWNDGDDATTMTPFFMMPKSQLAGGSYTNFKSAVINFGEYDQDDVYFDVDITKNSQSVFHKETPKKYLPALVADTALIADSYAPADFGHYKVVMDYKQKETEQTPQNDQVETYFNITDSAYSHADNTAEQSFCWGFEAYGSAPNLGHMMGSVYPIFADCEVNSISAFIAGGKADGMIDFRFKLFAIPTEGDDLTPIELLGTEGLTLDSTMLGTWITLLFDKDGESEFLKKGQTVYACVEYNNLHEDMPSRRYDNLKIGADYSFRILDLVSVVNNGTDFYTSGFGADRNLMIRLNLNDHSNINDGIDQSAALSSLGQNFPNPFSRTTDIFYELANGSAVSIIIRDITGRIILERSEGIQPAGKHTVTIDASNLDSGIYFYTLNAGNFNETRRMTVGK